MKRLVLVITLVLLGVGSLVAVAQQASPAAPDRALVLSAARDVMKQARFATLVTVSVDGQPQARVVDPSDLPPEGGNYRISIRSVVVSAF